jgi:ABC-2 type transport system ATP-binding protein
MAEREPIGSIVDADGCGRFDRRTSSGRPERTTSSEDACDHGEVTVDAGVAVRVRGLEKSYDGAPAVRGVDFEIRQGEIFALLGPNGAGKTTIVEILEGYRRRDAGEVTVLGLDPWTDRKALTARIGIVLQSTGVDRYLSVAETIEMYSSYYPEPRDVDELLELVGLEDKRDARVLSLSGGQQRRLDVAIGLSGDPDLIFLDEPTTGFDPSARRGAWEMVKNLAALGKTVLLTTHFMDEAQYLADRVAVIANGRFVAEGTPATLAGRNTQRVRLVFPFGESRRPPDELGWTVGDGDVATFEPDDLAGALHALSAWAVEVGATLDGLEIVRPSLEDVYLQLTDDAAHREPGRATEAGSS